MPDYFQILDQPRRPWLEAEPLKEAFHRLAAIRHPDVAATGNAAAFALLNTAYVTLREPAARLRHLLELETGPVVATAQIPPALANIFMQFAARRSQLEGFRSKSAAASSSLARALLAVEKKTIQEEWSQLVHQIDAANRHALDRLRELDAHWQEQRDDSLRHALVSLLEEFAYLGRWNAQLREVMLSLEL